MRSATSGHGVRMLHQLGLPAGPYTNLSVNAGYWDIDDPAVWLVHADVCACAATGLKTKDPADTALDGVDVRPCRTCYGAGTRAAWLDAATLVSRLVRAREALDQLEATPIAGYQNLDDISLVGACRRLVTTGQLLGAAPLVHRNLFDGQSPAQVQLRHGPAAAGTRDDHELAAVVGYCAAQVPELTTRWRELVRQRPAAAAVRAAGVQSGAPSLPATPMWTVLKAAFSATVADPETEDDWYKAAWALEAQVVTEVDGLLLVAEDHDVLTALAVGTRTICPALPDVDADTLTWALRAYEWPTDGPQTHTVADLVAAVHVAAS